MRRIGIVLFFLLAFFTTNSFAQPAASTGGRTFDMEACDSPSLLDKPTCVSWPYFYKLEIKLKEVPKGSSNVFAVGAASSTIQTLNRANASGVVSRSFSVHEYLSVQPQYSFLYLEELRRDGFERFLIIDFSQNVQTPEELKFWAKEFAKDPNVESVHYLPVVKTFDHTNDPLEPKQWGLHKMSGRETQYNYGFGSKDVYVVVFDTGVSSASDHEDMPNLCFNINTSDSDSLKDKFGHGTHVGGIIAAVPDNARGITGLAGGVNLCSVKVLNDKGLGEWSGVVNGILSAVQKIREIKVGNPHAQFVFNFSLGGRGIDPLMGIALQKSFSEGVHVFAAAGNSGVNIDNIQFTPASIDGVIAVAATDENDEPAFFSNRATVHPIVAAPGVNIPSCVPTKDSVYFDPSGYKFLSGTSMSSPAVAASAALALSHAHISREQMISLVQGSTDPLPNLERFVTGGGRHNMLLMFNLPDKPPETVSNVEVSKLTHSLARLKIVTPPDSTGRRPFAFLVYGSTKPFDEASLDRPDVRVQRVVASGKVGEWFNINLTPLEQKSAYYFGVKAMDRMGGLSPLSVVLNFTTNPAEMFSANTFTTPRGEKDLAGWTVAEGPLADEFKAKFGSVNELLWHLSNIVPDNRWNWRFGRENFLDYWSDGATDAVVKSAIIDWRGLRGGSLYFDYFQQVLSAAKYDQFEVHVIELDDNDKPVSSTAVARFDDLDNSKALKMTRRMLDLTYFEGKKFQLAFRFISYSGGETEGIGSIFGNIVLYTDQPD